MCGIFSYIYNLHNTNDVNGYYDIKVLENFNNLKKRGPDNSQCVLENNIFLGFHRLSINDITTAGNQPMNLNNYYLVCNGEIFNHKKIISDYNFKTNSSSDCEVILHLYDYLINQIKNININNLNNLMTFLCNKLDGEFSFVLYDKLRDYVFIARDPYGVRPLFIGTTTNNDYLFASELKGFNNLVNKAKQFEPGTFMIIKNNYSNENFNIENTRYHNIFYDKSMITKNENDILIQLNNIFREAVYKRMMSDKEICSLLSGGLDSSLVASIISEKLGPNKLKTFAIGIKGSPDLKYAQMVADHIKSVHHSIELTEQDFLEAIEEVIIAIESYDTTTVRASVGNYLVSKYIKENTDCKVIFNGDYADEVCGGYKYFKKTNSDTEFHNECIRLVNDIHYFDCLRSDRTISNNGLEARVPFADKFFINYYLSISSGLRMSCDKIEKYMLRKAFMNDNLLPEEILWRQKEAFSDGVTAETRSWYEIIQEFVDKQITDEYFEHNKNKYTYNTPILKESFYYREIFEKYYRGFEKVIPYFWLPKWCGDMTDPSAREIQ
jgi:asparagine synthase (glutamine-hydrolysing)